MVARMPVSSPTRPSFNGTFKSTRMNARSPRRSRSRIEIFANAKSSDPQILISSNSALDYQPKQIDAAVRISPFVVVPGHDLHEIAVHDLRVRGVDDRGIRVALEVDRHQLLVRIGENPFERPFC